MEGYENDDELCVLPELDEAQKAAAINAVAAWEAEYLREREYVGTGRRLLRRRAGKTEL